MTLAFETVSAFFVGTPLSLGTADTSPRASDGSISDIYRST
jgi:hypothetical protein